MSSTFISLYFWVTLAQSRKEESVIGVTWLHLHRKGITLIRVSIILVEISRSIRILEFSLQYVLWLQCKRNFCLKHSNIPLICVATCKALNDMLRCILRGIQHGPVIFICRLPTTPRAVPTKACAWPWPHQEIARNSKKQGTRQCPEVFPTRQCQNTGPLRLFPTQYRKIRHNYGRVPRSQEASWTSASYFQI